MFCDSLPLDGYRVEESNYTVPTPKVYFKTAHGNFAALLASTYLTELDRFPLSSHATPKSETIQTPITY